MKLTAKIKLKPTEEQRHYLSETLERANDSCNYISECVWNSKQFDRVLVHKMTYNTVREQSKLSAQVAVRCTGKVVDEYELDEKCKHSFRKHGAIAYNSRILTYKLDQQSVSIWTIVGLLTIPLLAGERQLQLLQSQQGESDLAYSREELYLFATCDIEESEPTDVTEFLGVELGVKTVACDSDGQMHSTSHVNNARMRYAKLRKKLQKKGTKSAKRLLKKRHNRESSFINDVTHPINKQLEKKGQGTQRGIRKRVTIRKSQRLLLHSWAFNDLRQKIACKAQMNGVPVVYVDPRNTSKEYSVCGCADKRNRQTQEKFSCIQCGYSAHADYNTAVNIGRWAAVNRPQADTA